MKLLAALLATSLLAGTAQAQTASVAQAPADARIVARATSPDKTIALAISIDNDGRASYSIARRGKPILGESRLGFLFTDAPKMDRGMKLLGTTTDSVDTSWTQPFGEWKTIRDKHNELTIRLVEANR